MASLGVYCGLAQAGERLGVAVVDDAGRVLAVVEVTDDPAGYGTVVGLLAEQTATPAAVPIAADAETRVIARLFAAAGRLIAFADPSSVGDPDTDGRDEAGHAGMLARALQRGALLPTPHPAPRDLAALRPVLAAHSALITGRQASAVALREVLRELYPAALRAYRDPAELIPLAVLDSLPEPGLPVRVKPAQLAENLVNDGLAADVGEVAASIEALRTAVTGSPRKAGLGRSTTAAVAAAVRQAVAAVRAGESGAAALVEALNDRLEPPGLPGRPAAAITAANRATTPPPAAPAAPSTRRRARPEPEPTPAPQAFPPAAPESFPPAAAAAPQPPVEKLPTRTGGTLPPPPPGIVPVFPGTPAPLAPAASATPPTSQDWPQPKLTLTSVPTPSSTTAAMPVVPAASEEQTTGRGRRNLSGAFSTMPGQVSGRRRGPEPTPPPAPPAQPPAPTEQSAPFTPRVMPVPPPVAPTIVNTQPTLLPAPPNQPQQTRIAPPWQSDDLPEEPPALRLVEPAPLADPALRQPPPPPPQAAPPRKPSFAEGSLMPGPEPTLNLDGPDSLAPAPHAPEERPLRLVGERDGGRAGSRRRPAARATVEPRTAPIPEEGGDGELLIFSAARSAWFTDPNPESEFEWGGTADAGWRAADKASRPAVGGTTGGGLPRRVPQANLVPGSAAPLTVERPMPARRDAAEIAAHTSGYFRGWQRGRGVEA
ncbi:transposase [Longispora urticae]